MKCVLFAAVCFCVFTPIAAADDSWGDTDRTREIVLLKKRVDALESAESVPGPAGPAGPAGAAGAAGVDAELEDGPGFPWLMLGLAAGGLAIGVGYQWRKQG